MKSWCRLYWRDGFEPRVNVVRDRTTARATDPFPPLQRTDPFPPLRRGGQGGWGGSLWKSKTTLPASRAWEDLVTDRAVTTPPTPPFARGGKTTNPSQGGEKQRTLRKGGKNNEPFARGGKRTNPSKGGEKQRTLRKGGKKNEIGMNAQLVQDRIFIAPGVSTLRRRWTMSVAAAPAATSRSDWKRWPRTEAFIDRLIDRGLAGNGFAVDLAGRMIRETGTPLKVWVDHLGVSGSGELAGTMAALGYQRQPMGYSVGVPVYVHPGGIFPRIALVPSSAQGDEDGVAGVDNLAIKVESIAAFSRAHDLGLDIL